MNERILIYSCPLGRDFFWVIMDIPIYCHHSEYLFLRIIMWYIPDISRFLVETMVVCIMRKSVIEIHLWLVYSILIIKKTDIIQIYNRYIESGFSTWFVQSQVFTDIKSAKRPPNCRILRWAPMRKELPAGSRPAWLATIRGQRQLLIYYQI